MITHQFQNLFSSQCMHFIVNQQPDTLKLSHLHIDQMSQMNKNCLIQIAEACATLDTRFDQ